MECPDEHYFINIVNCMFPLEEIKKVKDYQICFCSFRLTNTQGIEHKIVSRVLVEKIKKYGIFLHEKSNRKECNISRLYQSDPLTSNNVVSLAFRSLKYFGISSFLISYCSSLDR